jgi:hypothetical protein
MAVFLHVTVFLLALPYTSHALGCTSSAAIGTFDFPSSETPDSDTSVTDICSQFKSDPAEYQACTENALIGQCNSVGCPDSASDTTGDLISNSGDDLIGSGSNSDDSGLIKTRRAEQLNCNTSEMCLSDTSGVLYCVDEDTGKLPPSRFHSHFVC